MKELKSIVLRVELRPDGPVIRDVYGPTTASMAVLLRQGSGTATVAEAKEKLPPGFRKMLKHLAEKYGE